ncbi:MAG: signal peptidase I [Verrucomicrobia bacterium]|nr:signal peptidase I [Verrucomicrobiota bacterium]
MTIIAWWKRYQSRKQARELVKNTRKLLRMHRDIIDAKQLKYLKDVCDDLKRRAIGEDRPHLIVELSEELEKGLAKTFPHAPGASLRENVEVFLVAAIVAMAIRSFFIQPFKIPTGSMQPTLYGLHEAQEDGRGASLPKRIFDCMAYGKWPTNAESRMPNSLLNFISWIGIGKWPFGAAYTLRGDHIFVDRFTYHFRKPQRGEIIVFETNDIYTDLISKFRFSEYEREQLKEKVWNKFYIKRLVGIGGDRVQIEPPHLILNGKIADDHIGFRRMHSGRDGYQGYVTTGPLPPPCFLGTPADVFEVPNNYYFVLGDNSRSSFDGRFWGGFPRQALIGRAVLVYWPFTRRFGFIQ